MATYYWVGGSGTWDNSNTANWSSTSGGTGGAGFPGSADTAIIDNNSGSPTITTGAAISISSFQLAATSTSATVSLGNTFTTGSAGTTSITGGTFTTNNNTVTFNTTTISGTAARTLNLGSSTVNVSANFTISGSNITLNAGTSTINMTQSSGATFAGNGLTFYNVVFTTATNTTTAISGSNTFNNLTFSGNSGVSAANGCKFTGNQTINGTLTVSASTSANRRFFIRSNTQGTQVTLTAAAVSLTNVDFRDIIGAGAASWSGTSIGNATNNSGITFTTPKTVYWNSAAGGTWTTTNAWATSAGGATSDANYPLPQDTAYIVDTGLNTSATVLTGGQRICNLDISGRTLAMTLGTASLGDVCGNITLSSVVTFSGNGLDFYGTTTFTPNAATITASNIRTQAPATLNISGAITSTGSLTTSAGSTITLGGTSSFSVATNNGTLTLNNNTLTGATCTLGSGSTTNFGTGKISLTGSGATIFSGSSTQTISGTPNVECTYSGATGTRTIASGTTSASNAVNVNIIAGSDTVTVSASNNVNSLNFTGFSGTWTPAGISIFGDLTVSTGMTVNAGTSTVTFGSVSTQTITTNGKTLDFPITINGVGGTCRLSDNLLQGSTRASILTNGTLDLNGKTFTVGSFATASGTKNITFNGGTLVCPASTTTAFNNTNPTNFTTTAGTGTGKISMTGATAKTFVGGGSTYNCTLEQAGAGTLTITGSNTFNNITNTTQPVSVLFTAGTTNTFNNFSLSGTSGNLVTIGSVTAASHTLSKSSGTVSVQYCSISRSTATGGAVWESLTTNGNVDGGNNSGWIFAYGSGNGLLFGSNF